MCYNKNIYYYNYYAFKKDGYFMPSLKTKGKPLQPATTISLSFLSVIIVGTLLLMMPFSSASHRFTDPITCFFTATSATCVTGLVAVDTGSYWSVAGQLIILLMIQVGGLGLVTFASFFNFILGKKLELHNMQVASESVNTSGLYDVKALVKSIIKISFVCEFVGALLLMPSLILRYGARGIYFAFFLSVAAFCNAGFDVLGMAERPFSSLMSLSGDPGVMIVIPSLIIAGGLGFYVWTDIVAYPKKKRLSLQSKLVVLTTFVLIASGTLLTMIFEWNNPSTLGGRSFIYKLANSFFTSVTCRTAGFNTLDMAHLTPLSKMTDIFLMFIGVAPGSTGGGIKLTSLAIVVMTIVCVIRNKSDTLVFGRKIEKDLVYKAISITLIMMVVIIITSILLWLELPQISGLDVTFEVTSAISTTGLSTGVTGACSVFSKLLLCLAMLIGRIGPVGFAISLSLKKSSRSKNEVYPDGKLMVG